MTPSRKTWKFPKMVITTSFIPRFSMTRRKVGFIRSLPRKIRQASSALTTAQPRSAASTRIV